MKRLTAAGHEALPASPRTGVDATTGRGLAEALKGAQVVVDVANSPSFEDAAVLAFFENSGRNLARAEREAGVRHHVALSIVGAERAPDSGYMRAKIAQEAALKASGIRTIVRATQFFEFLTRSPPPARPTAVFGFRRARSSPSQPRRRHAVTDAALAEPTNGTADIAGPERLMSDLTRVIWKSTIRGRSWAIRRHAILAPARRRSLVPTEGRPGRSTGDWIRNRAH